MLAPLVVGVCWLLYISLTTYRSWRTQVPGPWYTNLTSFVLKYHELTRNRRLWIHGLHQQYGPVVRLAPNEVSFSNLEGMKEIYQSGGSGYEKTEFYDLFKQYDHRTMFTTLGRHEVGFSFPTHPTPYANDLYSMLSGGNSLQRDMP